MTGKTDRRAQQGRSAGGAAFLELADDALGDIAYCVNRADHLLLADHHIVEQAFELRRHSRIDQGWVGLFENAEQRRRLKGIGSPVLLYFWAIFAGSGVVIAVMLATGTLKPDIVMLVPVGSMIIANAMNACAQAAERFRADVTAHVGQIEAGLALGAEPAATVAPYVQSAVYASLLPRLDMLKSLGLVWIPGVMAGMVLSGASPVYAGIYQFIIVAID